MATKYINLKGTVKWCKCYEPDEFNGATRWLTNLYFKDDEEKKKFQDSGLQMTIKKDDDGEFISIRRDVKKLIGDNLVIFSPPMIEGEVSVKYVDSDGKIVRSYNKGDKVTVSREGEPKLIGNGSKVIAHLAVYDTKMGKGHRWESLTVLELDEYIPTTDNHSNTEEETVEPW